MPLPNSLEAFGRSFINRVMDEVTQERETRPRFFDSRVQEVESDDSEVFLYLGNKVIAADIIQLDQKAVVRRDTTTIRAASTSVPKFKHGFAIEENRIATLRRLERGLGTAREVANLEAYVARNLRLLLEGIKDRKELVYSALFMNQGSYDRLGIKFSSFNWGIQDNSLHPANLAGSARWITANAATMTPIANIRAWDDYQRINYGGSYNTLMLDESVLNAITICNEYLALAPAFAAAILNTNVANVTNAVLNGMAYQAKVNVLSAILGKKVEVRTPYKTQTQIETEAGGMTATDFWDNTYISLYDDSIFETDSLDFANVEVLETMHETVPMLIGEPFAEPMAGPVGYVTAADSQGNPPGEVLWAVQRGWPRLHQWQKKTAVKVA